MPYKSNSELSKAVQTALPAEAQTIFRKAFNAILAKNPDMSEERAFKQAWGAVRKAGWEPGPDKKWVHGKDAAFQVSELVALDSTANLRKTSDGYLIAYPRVARTGIQLYKGSEVGRPEMDEVRVYRSPEEVFAKDSIRSYAYKPMTNGHPPGLVTADTWRKYAVGHTGEEILKDGEHIRVPLVLMNSQAIKDVENGKSQLSLGYLMELDWGAGTTDEGEEYDAQQRGIRANHLALVDAARGGPMLNIGDHGRSIEAASKRRPAMDERTNSVLVAVDGIQIETNDMGRQIITKYLNSMQKQIERLAREGEEVRRVREGIQGPGGGRQEGNRNQGRRNRHLAEAG